MPKPRLVIPTAFDNLNDHLGGGMSGVVEVYGADGCGKSGLALSCSLANPVCVIDMDATCSLYLASIAGDPTNVSVVPYYSGEIVFEDILLAAVEKLPVTIVDPTLAIDRREWNRILPEVCGLASYTGNTLILVSGYFMSGDGWAYLDALTERYCQQRIFLHREDGRTRYRITKNYTGEADARGVLTYKE